MYDLELLIREGQADAGVPAFLRKFDFSIRMTVIRLPDEGLFLYPTSRTLVLTDLAFNVPAGKVWGRLIVYRLVGAEGVFGPHRFVRWSIRDGNAALRSLRTALEWDFGRVIVAHGDVRENGGKAKMKAAFAFILKPW
jgi:hypothetical protein